MKHLAPAGLLFAALLLWGCAPMTGPAGEPAAPDTLEDARALWASRGGDDYTYTIGRSCFCPPETTGPFEVTVRAGRITRVTRAGAPVDAGQADLPTVPGLFDLIAEAAEAGAAEVRVSYDSTDGHPVEVWIDRDRMMADEEMGYSVTRLVVE